MSDILLLIMKKNMAFNMFNQFFKKRIEYKILISAILLLLTLLYILNRHIIRPFVYANYKDTTVVFIFGALPNLIGAVIFYIFLRRVVFFGKIYASFYVIIYSFFHESLNYFIDDIKFDLYDVLTTIITIIVLFIIDIFYEK